MVKRGLENGQCEYMMEIKVLLGFTGVQRIYSSIALVRFERKEQLHQAKVLVSVTCMRRCGSWNCPIWSCEPCAAGVSRYCSPAHLRILKYPKHVRLDVLVLRDNLNLQGTGFPRHRDLHLASDSLLAVGCSVTNGLAWSCAIGMIHL